MINRSPDSNTLLNNNSDKIFLSDLIENNNLSKKQLNQQIKEIEASIETKKSNNLIQNLSEMIIKPVFRHITDIHSFNGLELKKLNELMDCFINSSPIFHEPSKHIIEIFNYNTFMYYQDKLFANTAKKVLIFANNM